MAINTIESTASWVAPLQIARKACGSGMTQPETFGRD